MDEAGIPPAHAEVFSARLRAKGGNNFLRHRIDKGLRRGLKDLRAGIAASEIHAIIAALIREHGPERAAAMFHRLRLKEIHAWATRARSKPRKKVPKPSPARRLPRKPR